MSDPGYEALRGLWDSKHGSKRFPAWSDFDQAELKRFWPHLMVLDVLPGQDFRYRHYGAGLAILFAHDFTDTVTSSLPPSERQRVEHDYVQALDGQARDVVMERRVDGIRYRNVRKLILPLGKDGETVDTLLVLLGVESAKI
jgi:hypothetical protein